MTKPTLQSAIASAVMRAFDAQPRVADPVAGLRAAAKEGVAKAMASPWLIRDALAEDMPGVVALWLEQAWRSRYGKRFLYDGGHGEFNERHKPRLEATLARSTTRIACDPDEPDGRFWGFAVTEAPNVVHAVLVKRQFHREKFSADMMKSMLGPLLGIRCFYSGELVDMMRHEVREGGLKVPDAWVCDEYVMNDVKRRSA